MSTAAWITLGLTWSVITLLTARYFLAVVRASSREAGGEGGGPDAAGARAAGGPRRDGADRPPRRGDRDGGGS